MPPLQRLPEATASAAGQQGGGLRLGQAVREQRRLTFSALVEGRVRRLYHGGGVERSLSVANEVDHAWNVG